MCSSVSSSAHSAIAVPTRQLYELEIESNWILIIEFFIFFSIPFSAELLFRSTIWFYPPNSLSERENKNCTRYFGWMSISLGGQQWGGVGSWLEQRKKLRAHWQWFECFQHKRGCLTIRFAMLKSGKKRCTEQKPLFGAWISSIFGLADCALGKRKIEYQFVIRLKMIFFHLPLSFPLHNQLSHYINSSSVRCYKTLSNRSIPPSAE